MPHRDEYLLGYRQAEQERLQVQAQQLAGESSWLFDQVALAPGARVVEIGCGPQGCLDLLAQRVGPSGVVIGVERSQESVELARRFVREQGLSNVEIIHGDARSTGLVRDSFDLVTSRLVLVNIPQPRREIVAEAVALARPGGSVAFHEADWSVHVSDPPLQAWDRAEDLLSHSTQGRPASISSSAARSRASSVRYGLVDVAAHPLIHFLSTGTCPTIDPARLRRGCGRANGRDGYHEPDRAQDAD